MAGSIGEALAKGVPVVMTAKDGTGIPEVICGEGKGDQALETMEKMGLIKLVRPQESHEDEEHRKTDVEVLRDAGWTVECESPFEISDKDGSRATGLAAHMVADLTRIWNANGGEL